MYFDEKRTNSLYAWVIFYGVLCVLLVVTLVLFVIGWHQNATKDPTYAFPWAFALTMAAVALASSALAYAYGLKWLRCTMCNDLYVGLSSIEGVIPSFKDATNRYIVTRNEQSPSYTVTVQSILNMRNDFTFELAHDHFWVKLPHNATRSDYAHVRVAIRKLMWLVATKQAPATQKVHQE